MRSWPSRAGRLPIAAQPAPRTVESQIGAGAVWAGGAGVWAFRQPAANRATAGTNFGMIANRLKCMRRLEPLIGQEDLWKAAICDRQIGGFSGVQSYEVLHLPCRDGQQR
jgi:hypothetical protein